MSSYSRLFAYAWREWRLLLVIVGLTLLSAAMVALQPWPMKILIDHALGGVQAPVLVNSAAALLPFSPSASLVVLASAAGLAVFAVTHALESGVAWSWMIAGRRMVLELSADVFARMQRTSLMRHGKRAIGDMLSRLTGDTWSIFTASDSLFVTPMQHLLVLATVGGVAWQLNSKLALISLLAAPALGGSAYFFGDRLQQRARKNREAQARVMSFVHQTLGAIPIVQAFNSVGRNAEHFRTLAAESVERSQRTVMLNTLSGVLNGLIITGGTALVLYIGALEIVNERLTIGGLLVFLAYLASLQSASEGLMASYAAAMTISANMDRVVEILDDHQDVSEPQHGLTLTRVRGDIALRGVSFGYDRGQPVLRDVTLAVAAGETVALVGATGSGKTTLVGLVLRFFDPWEGTVSIDGHDLRSVTRESLRNQISMVLQEPFLLPLSIRDNIAYGRPDATAGEVERAAIAANAHDFITALPDGYDTVLGERGFTLSGGERQRLAIARALLRDAPILILDEPTSALDVGTEAALLDALDQLTSGRTSLIIAHRLSTVRRADRIVVLDEGRIVESGTHEELLERRGVYHRYYTLNAGDVYRAEEGH